MLGMSVVGAGTIWRDATFKPINSEGGWCNYAVQIKKEIGVGFMLYYCQQWLSLNSRLPSLITSGIPVVVSGCWKITTKKQPDGTASVYHSITVSQLTFINSEIAEVAKISKKKAVENQDSADEAPW